MSRMLAFGLIVAVGLAVLGFVIYSYLAKAEERKIEEKKLEHEREMRLDELTFDDDFDEPTVEYPIEENDTYREDEQR